LFWKYVYNFNVKVGFEDDSKHTAAAGLFNFTLNLLPDRFRFSADEVRRYVNGHKPPKDYELSPPTNALFIKT
jgi:hypothetical protein